MEEVPQFLLVPYSDARLRDERKKGRGSVTQRDGEEEKGSTHPLFSADGTGIGRVSVGGRLRKRKNKGGRINMLSLRGARMGR